MSALEPTEEFRDRVLQGRGFAEAGDFQGAEQHFRTLLDEARGEHAGNHVLAMQSLTTLYGRSGRFLEALMLARRTAKLARAAGREADSVLAFALGNECGALSQLEIVEPLGRTLLDLREVLDRAPAPMVNVELKYYAAAGVHARKCGNWMQVREHLAAYRTLVRDANVEHVFRWALLMAQAQVAYHEGDYDLATNLVSELGGGEKTPPFHRLKELTLNVGVCARRGDAETARIVAEEALQVFEAIRDQSGLASGSIHDGTVLAGHLERLGEVDLAARVYDFVAAAVLVRLRQVDECTRELPELGLDGDDSTALLARFRREFLADQRELLRRVAELLAAQGDAYVQALFARSAPRGMIALCAWCESVRPSDGRWLPLGHYIPRDGSIELTHTICPPCAAREQAKWSEYA